MNQEPSSAPLREARYRVVFGKHGVLRYTSHLDLARIWERLLRRVNAPLKYSQGFNPRPQIHLIALPLGFESTGEILDMWLEGDIPAPSILLEQLHKKAPEGLSIYGIAEIDLKGDALQTLTRRAIYHAVPAETASADELQRRVDDLLARESIPRKRRRKQYDLRPRIHAISVLPDGGDSDNAALEMELALSPEIGTGRADEVLDALGFDPLAARIIRKEIILAKAGT